MLDLSWNGWGVVVSMAVIAVLTIALYPFFVKALRKARRVSNKPRCGALNLIHDPKDAEFEIVAVHGLAADPHHTWCHSVRDSDPTQQGPAKESRKIHLLQDLLCKSFPKARIWSFEHDSTWFANGVIKTTEEIGRNLLEELERKRSPRAQPLPIVFIGHSMGGIIIKQALCYPLPYAEKIMNRTSGIIFLGTPHQGSPLSYIAAFLARMASFFGSDATLLLSLQDGDSDLSNLADKFDACIRKWAPELALQIRAFYETKPIGIGWFSMLCVSRNSASVHANGMATDVDTDHSGLNKCKELEDPYYVKLKNTIADLRAPSILERADAVLKDRHYAGDRLLVERLNGTCLPLDQCYINLAIVERHGGVSNHRKQSKKQRSSNELLARQNVVMPNESAQIELPAIFCPIARDGSEFHPRRILIRGQAGIGKTTLCKKMVHDFICESPTALNRSWRPIFDRVLWIPLRNLKNRSTPGNYQDLFFDEFFQRKTDTPLAHSLAQELERELNNTEGRKTLLILDGLDEIIDQHSDPSPFVMELLNNHNVIITSRPNATLPTRVTNLDLELETVGFYPKQVKTYLERDPATRDHAQLIAIKLGSHWLLKDLMRIPIQLDAFCYTWRNEKASDTSDLDTSTLENPTLDTMTSIYKSIELKLWRKDMVRLGKAGASSSDTKPGLDVRSAVTAESEYLESLAFSGLKNGTMDFTPRHRRRFQISKKLTHEQDWDDRLAKLSFIRTSDPSPKPADRTYHFIHLTFQEYFAARYFVRQWQKSEEDPNLDLVPLEQKQESSQVRPVEFLRQHKYSSRFLIFWRFVAGLLAIHNDPDDEEIDEGKISTFFDVIETDPRDLLGPVHQRLVIHCLGEVSRKRVLPCRGVIEARLSKWVLFEYRLTSDTRLGQGSEVPENVLVQALGAESEEARISLLALLKLRPGIGTRTIRLMKTWLQHGASEDVKVAIFNVLRASRPGMVGGEKLELVEATLRQLEYEDLNLYEITQPSQIRSDTKRPPTEIITRLLQSRDPRVRKAAVLEIRDRPNLTQETMDTMVGRLSDENPDVRNTAIKVLWALSADLSPKNLLAVVTLLGDKSKFYRKAARSLLQNVAPDLGPGPIKALEQKVREHKPHISSLALKVLGKCPNLSLATFENIAPGLGSPSALIREATIRALGDQRNLSPEYVKAIAEKLKDDKNHQLCASTLNLLGSQRNLSLEIVKMIIPRLWDDKHIIRKEAAKALQNQRQLSSETIHDIEGLLTIQKLPDVYKAAIQALQNEPNLSQNAIEFIQQQTENDDIEIRQAAIKVLQGQPNLTETAIDFVKGRITDYMSIRRPALQILQKEPYLSLETIELIQGRLGENEPSVVLAAIQALQNRRNLSSGAIKAIAERLKHEDWGVRQAAVEALQIQEDLSSGTVKQFMSSLYRAHLESSFDEHVYWCLQDEPEALCMVFGSLKLVFKGRGEEFRDMLSKAKEDLEFAVPEV